MNVLIDETPVDYKQTKLYKKLKEKDVNTLVIDKVNKLIEHTSSLLETVGRGSFADYTLHNPLHSRKLLHLAGYVIPDKTLDDLSELELAVLIMSFYVHDLGMVQTIADRENVIKSEEFINYIESRSDISDAINKLKKDSNGVANPAPYDMSIAQLYDVALTDFLRPKHATIERYQECIKIIEESANDNSLFQIKDVSFKDELLLICKSHNEPTSTIKDTNLFKTSHPMAHKQFNIQYCAGVLRIVDVLDFDSERTPRSLFRAIGIENKQLPGFKISLREWTKQLATHSIVIGENELCVYADSNSPSIEHAIREMCTYIETQIKDTLFVLQQNPEEIARKYRIELPAYVKPTIRSIGYTYKNYSLKLNESAIIKLLMGENLYSKSQIAIRELVQNAIDACEVRRRIETFYTPEIKVNVTNDADGRYWLCVQDNGIGMDDKVLNDYFFKSGSSYYQSDEFKSFSVRKKIRDFVPISRFGIGLLSVFMIGDIVRVTTVNKHSSIGDTKQRTLIIDSSESLAVVKETEALEEGTKIEVQLRKGKDTKEFVNALFGCLKESFIRPSVSISVKTDGLEYVISNAGFISLKDEMLDKLNNNHIRYAEINLDRYSKLIRGKAFVFLFEKEDGKLSYKDPLEKVNWGIYPLKPSVLFDDNISKGRVTVNGISMTVKKLAGLFNTKKREVPFIVDMDVVRADEIDYDVSRTRVRSNGIIKLRKELYQCVMTGMKELGISQLFDEETIKQFKRAETRNLPSAPLDTALLKMVESLVPSGKFKVSNSLAGEVAKQIDEDPTVIIKYLYAISNNRIS